MEEDIIRASTSPNMDYNIRIAVILCFLAAFFYKFTSGQNIAESSFLSNNHQERKRLNNLEDLNVQRPSGAFHDIYTVLGQGGETQRVHYAVDDRGVRADIQSNSVHLSEKPDPESVFFGSRLSSWSSAQERKDSSGLPLVGQVANSPQVQGLLDSYMIPQIPLLPGPLPNENSHLQVEGQDLLPLPVNNQESFDPYRITQFSPPSGPLPDGRLIQGEVTVQNVNPNNILATDDKRGKNPQLFFDESPAYEPIRISKPDARLTSLVDERRDIQLIKESQPQLNRVFVEKDGFPNKSEGFVGFSFKPPPSPVTFNEPSTKILGPFQLPEMSVPGPNNLYDRFRSPKASDFQPRVQGLESYLTMFNKPIYDSRIPKYSVDQQLKSAPFSTVYNSSNRSNSFDPKPNVVPKTQSYLDSTPTLKSNSYSVIKSSMKRISPEVEVKSNASVEKSQPEKKVPSLFSVLSKTPAPEKSIDVVSGDLRKLDFTKPIISAPMSTIFDTEKKNGQYYHYVMNVGRKSDSNLPGIPKLFSTGNGLFKILNQTGIHFQPDRITYINTKNSSFPVDGLKKITIKPLPTTAKKAKGTQKKKSNTKKYDLITAGDTEDIIKTEEVSPTLSNVKLSMNASADTMKEINRIINTEEPREEDEEKSLPQVKLGTEPNENASTKFLTELNGTSHSKNNQVPFYSTEPEPLQGLMGNIQDEDIMKEKDNEMFIDALLSDYTTAASLIQDTTLSASEQTTSTTIEPTTSNAITVTGFSITTAASLETTTFPPNSSNETGLVSTMPPESPSEVITSILELNASSTEKSKDDTNVTEVMVEVTNFDQSKESVEKKTTEQQDKPMLELLIQNTEMNDFMSRINNMPIMIRVLNAQTEKVAESSEVENQTDIPTMNKLMSEREVLTTDPLISSDNSEDNTKEQTTTVTSKLTDALVTTVRPTEKHTKGERILASEEVKVEKLQGKETKLVTTKGPRLTKKTKSSTKNERSQKKENNSESFPNPESHESSVIETLDTHSKTLAIQQTLANSEITEPRIDLPNTIQMMGDMGFLRNSENGPSYLEDAILLPVNGNRRTDSQREEPLQFIPVLFEDDLLNPPQSHYDDVEDSYSSSMSSVQDPYYGALNNQRNFSLPAIRDTVSHSPYNLPSSVEYVDVIPYEGLETEGASGDSNPPESVMYLDSYDTMPENDGNKQYVFLSDSNLEIPSLHELYPQDSSLQQPALIPMRISPKFGSRMSP